MNILIDAHVFDDKYQGTRTYLKGLYSELIPLARHWNFFMVANDIANLKAEFGEHENLTYVQLKHHNKFYRLLIEMPSIIKNYKIDYTHFQYIGSPIKVGKHIVTTHDILFEQDEFKSYFPLKYRLVNGFLFKRSAKQADILLTVSNYSRHKISEHYSIPIENIHITPNAVDREFHLNSNIEISNSIEKLGKFILYVARIEPRKNHLALLKAFTELQLGKKGYKLVFVGRKDIPNPELDHYIASSKEFNGDSVVWFDNIPNNQLSDYYKNCELFVFPSFAEGFGIPSLEAMVFNKKILCSNATAMSDFELPESVMFNPNDLEELKNKIIEQLESEFNLKNEYKTILSKYRWDAIAKDFMTLLSNEFKKGKK